MEGAIKPLTLAISLRMVWCVFSECRKDHKAAV